MRCFPLASLMIFALLMVALPTASEGQNPAGSPDTIEIFLGDAVEVAPIRLQCPMPGLSYDFRSTVTDAAANVTFIVDTEGRVQASSIDVSATDEVLGYAVRNMIAGCVFAPGRAEEKAVLVKMEMPVTYSAGFVRYRTNVFSPPPARMTESERQAELVQIRNWFLANFEDYGSFSVRLTDDMSESMFATGRGAGERAARNRAVQIRHTTSDVSVHACSLAYLSTYQMTGGDPLMLRWSIPFSSIDPNSIRVQQLDMPYEVRALQTRSEVYLHARREAFFIVVIPEERMPRSSLEHSIPVGSPGDAQEIAEKIREALPLCVGR